MVDRAIHAHEKTVRKEHDSAKALNKAQHVHDARVADEQPHALVARDGGCIVPGCKRKARWCEAHHVVPWPKGPTNLANLVLLCNRHHKQVHGRSINLQRDPAAERWMVTRADGTPLRERPPPLAA